MGKIKKGFIEFNKYISNNQLKPYDIELIFMFIFLNHIISKKTILIY